MEGVESASEREREGVVAPAHTSERFARTILERAQEIICVVDIAARFRFVTSAVVPALGYQVDEVVGACGFDLVHPEDLGGAQQLLAQTVATANASVRAELRLRTRAGEWRDYELSAINLLHDPIIEGVLINARDVTARRTAERALHDREKAFALLLGNLQGMAYRCRNDANWTMVLASQGALAITGYDVDELIDNRVVSFNDLIHPDDAGPLWEKCQSNLAARRSCNNEYRIRRKDGQWRWVVDLAAGVYDEGGALLAIEGFLTDVTSRHELEERLAHSQRLEGIGRLAGGIAHDFNNLIGAMLGYADLALEGVPAASSTASDIAEIRAAAERAAALTRQLLAFSRRQVLQTKVLDLTELFRGLERLLRRVITEQVELATSFAADLWLVEADPGQLEQVVINLAVNARDAMPQGGRLTLTASNVQLREPRHFGDHEIGAGEFVSLVVEDTGEGMSDETQRHLFEPFFTTKAESGTGLGLATCYGIVRQLGGAISARGEPGRGSAFTLYLPRCHGSVSPRVAAPAKRQAGGDESILLVEDDAQLRESTRRALESAGYRVCVAAHADEALRQLARPELMVALLVTDVLMPGMSGAQLAEIARRTRPELPVLYVSGYVEGNLVALDFQGKNADFVAKPFSLRELCDRVRALLDRVG